MRFSKFYLGVITVVLLGLIWINQFILHLGEPLSQFNEDPALASFILKHYIDVFFSGSWDKIATLPMFYGLKYSLFLSDHHLPFGLIAIPIFAVSQNIIWTTNFISVISVLSSLISMYIFTFYITKAILPSILASVIFALNPYVAAHFPDHLILIMLAWIPMIFLFFEKSIENPSKRNIFFFFIFLALQLLTSLYYSAFLSVILPVYIIFRILQKKLIAKRFFNSGFILGSVIFLVVLLGSAYLYNKANIESRSFRYEPTNIVRNSQRNAIITESFSPQLKDIFIDSLHKNIVHSFFLNDSLSEINVAEKTYFLGFATLILLIISIPLLYRSSQWQVYFLMSIFTFFISLGPIVKVTDNLNFPGIYQLFLNIDPLFQWLRVPTRIAGLMFFFISLICALVLQKLLKSFNYRHSLIFGLILISLVTFEYLNWPVQTREITIEQKEFYRILNQQRQIKVIVDLPMGTHDSDYLMLATILHSKALLNGDTGFVPQQYVHLSKITLGLNFPSSESIQVLRENGVEGIVLHRDEYTSPSSFDITKKGLEQLGIKKIEETPNLALFVL